MNSPNADTDPVRPREATVFSSRPMHTDGPVAQPGGVDLGAAGLDAALLKASSHEQPPKHLCALCIGLALRSRNGGANNFRRMHHTMNVSMNFR